MKTPPEHFKEVFQKPADLIPALVSLVKQYGLTPIQAKEIWAQSEGSSLDEYQKQIAVILEQLLQEKETMLP